MSTVAPPPLMTVRELLALPDDGLERDLIDGQLRERAMTRRSRRHSRTTTHCAKILANWCEGLPSPRGELLTGDAGFLLRKNPDTTVGIDVAFVSPELARRTSDDAFLIEGAPILAVEILSRSDTHEDIVEKIELLLDTGVRVVWIVDPDLRTVTVHRAGAEPTLFNSTQELCGDPELPGFRVPVVDLFAK